MHEFIDIIPNVIKIIRDMLGLRSQSAFKQTCRYFNEHSTDYKLLVHAHFFPTEMAYQKKIF